MADKPVKPVPTLTELTTSVKELAAELDRHTEGRNYLFRVATGDVPPPILSFSSFGTDNKSVNNVSINMRGLTQEVSELIVAALIEHEEKMAIACWRELNAVTTQATEIVQQFQVQRDDAVRQSKLEGEPGFSTVTKAK